MTKVHRVTHIFALIAGCALIIVALLICIGVISRYVFDRPIFGLQDVLQLLLVPMTMFGMAYCARTNGHISVDLFENLLGRWGRLVGDSLSRVIGIVILVLLAWGSYQQMVDAWKWGDVTNLLQIPVWPFSGVICFSALLYALVLLLELISPKRLRPPEQG